MIKNFISITKPGIIFGNLITVSGGFYLAAAGHWYLSLWLTTILGISLIIAAGCVFNNIIDRDIDQLMKRTCNRVMVKRLISAPTAFIYGCVLAISGSYLLLYFANLLTLSIALVGLFFYVVVYSLGFKRNSIYGTLIGSISGAVPPVVGYCALRNSLDLGALILFAMLSLWQMPHSYAIAIFRVQDYAAAKIPVLPLARGVKHAKVSMLIYVLIFTLVASLLTVCGYAGKWYLVVSLSVGFYWLRLAVLGFYITDDQVWARKMFAFSVLAITILAVAMSLNSLPHLK